MSESAGTFADERSVPQGAPLPYGAAPPNGAGPQRRTVDPAVVMIAALVLGIALAKVLDWRSHAHPRA